MIYINLLKDEQSTSVKKKNLSRTVALVSVVAMSLGSCSTFSSNKKTLADGTVVDVSSDTDSADQQDIPLELRNASRFDPAQTLDQKVVQASDFYQIKQAIEKNKQILEAAWKEQEAIEARVKAALSEESQRKAALAKQEEEERERRRQIAAEEYEKSKDIRAKYEDEAQQRVKKMPTISRSDELWNGLED